jgi:hypothetical protein
MISPENLNVFAQVLAPNWIWSIVPGVEEVVFSVPATAASR